jgi:hypothetical protein
LTFLVDRIAVGIGARIDLGELADDLRHDGIRLIVQGGDKTSHWNASEVLSVAE